MKPRKGPRPWSIAIFAAVLGATATWNLGVDLQRALTEPEEAMRIAMVSEASARFLIPVIPAAAIWLYASSTARWFVTIASVGFAAFRLGVFGQSGLPDATSAIRFAIGLAMNGLVLLLFTRSARRWFATEENPDATE